jgi:hypothetical protein
MGNGNSRTEIFRTSLILIGQVISKILMIFWSKYQHYYKFQKKIEKKYASTLDNYGQSCFVRSDFFKMKCVCKTQMMPPPDHQNPVDMHTSIMCINILQNIKAVGGVSRTNHVPFMQLV